MRTLLSSLEYLDIVVSGGEEKRKGEEGGDDYLGPVIMCKPVAVAYHLSIWMKGRDLILSFEIGSSNCKPFWSTAISAGGVSKRKGGEMRMKASIRRDEREMRWLPSSEGKAHCPKC